MPVLPLLVTQGDPAGIGLELTLALWHVRRQLALPDFVLIASANSVRQRARLLGLSVPIVPITTPDEAVAAFEHGLPVIDHGHEAEIVAGQPSPHGAPGTLAAIEMAVSLVRTGQGRAIVTNPIAKSVLYDAGFRHPGHTEFLAALAADGPEPPPRPVMMIWSETLAVVPVTIHIPLRDVPLCLTEALIIETGVIVDRDLRQRFGVAAPRLALAGLNPHAGEGGALGHEDGSIIAGAVAALRTLGIDARGPLPADTMFHARARAGYDVALTMYHDQGLIPVKTLAFDEGVNVTLGLPFVRTSPDHGTAFDIAGKGIARPDSLLAALRLADRLTARIQASGVLVT
ncbi:MAG: 4-hydroxythreonine-4-phosphate dehydrogenase PdxA [Bosea sp. (in: a-proteobacteria)]